MNIANPKTRISALEVGAFPEPQSKRVSDERSAWTAVLTSWMITVGFATVLAAVSAPSFADDSRLDAARVNPPATETERPKAAAVTPSHVERRYWPGDFDHGCSGPWDAQGRQIGMSADKADSTAAVEHR
jgi:hypothetical protein